MIPQHHAVLQIESHWEAPGRSALRSAIGGGYSSVMDGDGLEPMDGKLRHFDGSGHRLGNFVAGYLQVERSPRPDLRAYLRSEFPARGQAVTLQIAATRRRSRQFGAVRLQWSAALL